MIAFGGDNRAVKPSAEVQSAFEITFIVIASRAVAYAASYNNPPSPSVGRINLCYYGSCRGPVDFALFVGATGAGLAFLRLLWKVQFLGPSQRLRKLANAELVKYTPGSLICWPAGAGAPHADGDFRCGNHSRVSQQCL